MTAFSTKKRNKRDLRYFYMNDKLYKLQTVVRENNLCICWDYENEAWVRFNWTDVRRLAQKSYTTRQVGEMLNRGVDQIIRYINAGELPAPPKSFPLQGNTRKLISPYRWSDKHIMQAHDLFSKKYLGPVSNFGVGRPKKMPNKIEIRAMLADESIQYIKTETGEFKQIWQEGEW